MPGLSVLQCTTGSRYITQGLVLVEPFTIILTAGVRTVY